MITILGTGASAKTYSDVPTSHWAYTAIDDLSDRGFIDGNSLGQFEPNKNMTRAEACVFIGKTLGVNITNNNVSTGFSDVPSGSQYAGYVKWAKDRGIFSGTSSTMFSPNSTITREQFCVALNALFTSYHIVLNYTSPSYSPLYNDDSSISSWARYAVYLMRTNGIVDGTSPNTFSPQMTITRAQITLMMYNVFYDYIYDMFTSSSLLGNKVWFLKMNMGTTSNPNYQYSQVMNKLTNQSGMYPGWNADEQYIRITYYTDTTGQLNDDLTNDC
ncbi:MAG: S-layer homology domain-containing protein, partial [Clostridia bacterium]|nr:S-layer homology domain-containing protein [Clostridia bacterium]